MAERNGAGGMITDGDNEVLAGLLDGLDRVEADNAQLRSEMDSQRRRRPAPSTPASGGDRGEIGTRGDHDQALSRRGGQLRNGAKVANNPSTNTDLGGEGAGGNA